MSAARCLRSPSKLLISSWPSSFFLSFWPEQETTARRRASRIVRGTTFFVDTEGPSLRGKHLPKPTSALPQHSQPPFLARGIFLNSSALTFRTEPSPSSTRPPLFGASLT